MPGKSFTIKIKKVERRRYRDPKEFQNKRKIKMNSLGSIDL